MAPEPLTPVESRVSVEMPELTFERAPRALRVALVNMPFAAAHRPSIACGLLKAALARAGHNADVVYLNLELAAELGAAVYRTIASMRTDLFVGDWLFTAAAFGCDTERASFSDPALYRASCPGVDGFAEQAGLTFADLLAWRDERIPASVDRWLDATDWGAYDAVGFTCTFEQNVAAFALARRIKARFPHVITLFGGANFDGEMGAEYVRAFPWIDYAVAGEGDAVLPALVNRLARGQCGAGLPGVIARDPAGAIVNGHEAPAMQTLDALPDPDYDEYFAALRRLGRERVLGVDPPVLLFESARGCWWGAKHHCTFCGLNANGMTYRSKSPERVHAELRRQAGRYQIVNFEAVDNIIDMRYLDGLCRPISAERIDYTLFFEVKANLTQAQLQTMRRGGIVAIQPGIESLSTHILTLMRKGTTMLRNVRLLKWAHYYGMTVSWNMLFGFPGETAADYAEQERLIPLLAHLPPPTGCGPLWLERFSPYFTDPAFPVRNVRPRTAYRFIYPAHSVDPSRIAYFFDYDMDGVQPLDSHAELIALLETWQQRWSRSRPVLAYQRAPDWVQIVDRRGDAPRAFSFQGWQAAAYEFCSDTDHTPNRIAAYLNETHGATVDSGAVRAALQHFCDLGLMLAEDDHYLSLALPVNGNW